MEATLYEERIISRWNVAIMALVVFALLAALLYQRIVGPLGTEPAPNEFFIGMILFFVALGVNFAVLTVRVRVDGVTVGYGIIRHHLEWGNIVGCRLDEVSAVRYGGWGIRTACVGGKRRLVYNIISAPRVVVEKRTGKHHELVFSTRNPEAAMKAINEGLGKRS